MLGMKDIQSDVDNNANIYVYTVIAISARMSGHDDQFLNQMHRPQACKRLVSYNCFCP